MFIKKIDNSQSPVIAMWLMVCAATISVANAAEKNDAWNANNILGSKHDLTSLNQRAGVEAMAGVAYSDYGNACIYCHLPPEEDESQQKPGQIEGWNRIRPVTKQYELYDSSMMENKPSQPRAISMLCLSCHDGTMALDRVVFKPAMWNSEKEATLHMQLNAGNDLSKCGKCHDGSVAHDVSVKVMGTDLRDDHPISMRYAGLDINNTMFKAADSPSGFNNGIKLFDGNVECASCHDVHNPSSKMLLRVNADMLCITCHTK